MKKNIVTASIVTAVVIVGSGIGFVLLNNDEDNKATDQLAMQKDRTADEVLSPQDQPTITKGSYADYNASKLTNAEKGKVVLYFRAPWCPICREADKNFETSAAPDGLTLLKVDYDSSTELKKKYGITYQHTFVQVDKDGMLLKKWSGSTTYDDITAQLN